VTAREALPLAGRGADARSVSSGALPGTSSSSLFSYQRRPRARFRRTSGLDAPAGFAGTPIASRDQDWESRSGLRKAVLY